MEAADLRFDTELSREHNPAQEKVLCLLLGKEVDFMPVSGVTFRYSAAKPDKMKELGLAIEKIIAPLAPLLFWTFFAGAFVLPVLVLR